MEQRRLQLILDEDTDRILKEIRASRDSTYTATIKRAVKLMKLVLDAKDDGQTLELRQDGKLVQTITIK